MDLPAPILPTTAVTVAGSALSDAEVSTFRPRYDFPIESASSVDGLDTGADWHEANHDLQYDDGRHPDAGHHQWVESQVLYQHQLVSASRVKNPQHSSDRHQNDYADDWESECPEAREEREKNVECQPQDRSAYRISANEGEARQIAISTELFVSSTALPSRKSAEHA